MSESIIQLGQMYEEQNKLTVHERIEAKNMLRYLEHHYRGWKWYLLMKSNIMRVHSPLLDMQWGWVVYPDLVTDWNKKAIKVGGDMLERYGFPRGPFRKDVYDMLVRRNRYGRIIHES